MINRKAWVLIASIVGVFAALAFMGKTAEAAPQSLTILGADGNAGQKHRYTEFSLDNGQTWSPAYLYGAHPWGLVAETSSWLNCAPSGDACTNQAVLYRVKFIVPEGSSHPEIAFDVKADNYVDIWVNSAYASRIESSGTFSDNATVNAAVYSGENEIRFLLTDAGGLAGFNYSARIDTDGSAPPTPVALADTAPPIGSFTINGGAGATNNPSVTLDFTCNDDFTGKNQVSLSGDGVVWGDWLPVQTTSYALSGVDGSKTIYAKFRDEAGNVSQAASRAITLDRIAPEPPVITLSTSELASEVTVTVAYSSDTATKEFQLWGDYANTYTGPFVLTQNRTISAYATDEAGNKSTTTVGVTNIDPNPLKVTAAINNGALFTSTAQLNLTFNDQGTGATQMRFSNDNEEWSSWENYATSKAYTLPSGDGLKTIYMEFKDAAANVRKISRTITLDTLAPSGTLTINGGAEFANAADVALALNDSGTGATMMQFSDNYTDWSDWEPYQAAKQHALSAGDGTKTLYARLKDEAGNTGAPFSAVIVLDRIPPVVAIGQFDETTPTSQDITVTATVYGGTLQTLSHTFTENGSFDFIATDAAGNGTTRTVTITNIDKIAPTTTSHTTIDALTKYVTIQLTASDNRTEPLTTYYTVDGVQQSGNTIVLKKQGAHLLTYWSQDTSGNTEAAQSQSVKVAILQRNGNGRFLIEDAVNVIRSGALPQQDMNGDGIFDQEDVRTILKEITPVQLMEE